MRSFRKHRHDLRVDPTYATRDASSTPGSRRIAINELEVIQLDRVDAGVSGALSPHQPALARPAARVRVTAVEGGIPLAQVRDLLGHASITTTERYDNQKLENLQAAVLKLEKGKSFDTNDPRAQKALDDRDKVSSFFQDQAKVSGIEAQEPDRKIGSKSKRGKELGKWLGGRDSNPDTMVQSHVSYRWTTSQCQSRCSAQ